jgi:hypothetical protein
MPMIQTDSQNYTDIANAIRSKTGKQAAMYPSEMAGEIESISIPEFSQVILDADFMYSIYGATAPSGGYIRENYNRADIIVTDHTSPSWDIRARNGDYALYFTQGWNKQLGLLQKIPSQCKRIEIDVEVPDGRTYEYNYTRFCLVDNPIPTGLYGNWNTIYKTAHLTAYDKTSEFINSQEGVTINSTTPYFLSKQTVVIDTSSINNDFYIGFYTVDAQPYLYEIRAVY